MWKQLPIALYVLSGASLLAGVKEMTALQFATVREYCVRRNWFNEEVVEALHAAEVIRGGG